MKDTSTEIKDVSPQDEAEKGLAEALSSIEKLEKEELQKTDSAHSMPSEENVPVEEAAPVKEPKAKKTKDWKEKRRHFQLAAEREQLALQNEQLNEELEKAKQLLNDTLYSNTYNYGRNVYSDLEKAKEVKKRALEEGDVDAVLEADVALNKAVSDVKDLESWAQKEEEAAQANALHEQQMLQQQQAAHEYQLAQEAQVDPATQALNQWVIEHPEVNPNSSRYNHGIAEEMANFANKLEQDLINSNKSNVLFSEAYFNKVNDHFNKVSNHFNKPQQSRTNNSYVGGVRRNGGMPMGSKPKHKVVLTSEEEMMAHNAGVDPEVWRKYKIEEMERQNG